MEFTASRAAQSFQGARFPEGSLVIVAVSGGSDSMALLTLAERYCPSKLVALHFNHRLQQGSLEQAKMLEAYCNSRKIRFEAGEPGQTPPTKNIESWARDARYRFLMERREKLGADWIFTAHTQSDVVETFLMRMLSNKEMRSIPKIDARRAVYRPLLDLAWKADLEQFCRDEGIPFWDDPMNSDSRFLRSRIRHTLLPSLRELLGASTDRVLLERQKAFEDDLSLLEAKAYEATSTITSPFGSRSWLRELRGQMTLQDRALRWRIISILFLPVVGFPVGRRHGERLAAFVLGNGARIELPGAKSVVRRDGGIEVLDTISDG